MTPEERADALVKRWHGERLSVNAHKAEIAAAVREAEEAAAAAERDRFVAKAHAVFRWLQETRPDLAAGAAELYGQLSMWAAEREGGAS